MASGLVQALLGPSGMLAASLALAACSTASHVAPPSPVAAASWAIDRQVLACRATRAGGTRTGIGGGPGLMVFGSVTAVTQGPAPEACHAILALSDQDIAEIRTFVQATAASGRGLQTHWTTAAGGRRDITLSVYPDGRQGGMPCRTVSASIELHGGIAPLAAPAAAALDEQRLCQTPAGAWQPA